MQTNKVHPQILHATRISSALIPALEKITVSCPWFSHGNLSHVTKHALSWLSDCQYGLVDDSNHTSCLNVPSASPSHPDTREELGQSIQLPNGPSSITTADGIQGSNHGNAFSPSTFSPASDESFAADFAFEHRNSDHCKSKERRKFSMEILQTPFKLVSSQNCTLALFEDETKGLGVEISEFLLNPLHTACASNVIQLVQPALECFQKMVAQGIVRGSVHRGVSMSPSENVVIAILNQVYDCARSCDAGSRIEVTCLKVLLSIFVSPVIQIQEDALVQIMDIIFSLYLRTNSTLHKAMCKGVLLQILSILFSSNDSSDRECIKQVNISDHFISKEVSFTQLCNVQSLLQSLLQDDAQSEPLNRHTIKVSFIKSLAACMRWRNETLDSRFVSRVAIESNSNHNSMGACTTTLSLKDPDVSSLENAFVAFQNLCKIASSKRKELTDSISVNEKVLALELLCFLFEEASSLLFTPGRFMDCLRQNLFTSLLEINSYGIPVFVQLSHSLFLRLILCSGMTLKPEISEFFPVLILRILNENSNAIFLNKIIALRFAENICRHPQILIDFYVNFDCGIHLTNVFESMVESLSNCARGPPNGSTTILSDGEISALRLGAVKVIVNILSAFNSWLKSKLDQRFQLDIEDDVYSIFSRSSFPLLPESTSKSTTRSTSDEKAPGEFDLDEDMSREVIPYVLPYASSPSASPTTASSTDSSFSLRSSSPRSAEFFSQKAKKFELQKGISIFNSRPSDGVNFLMKSPLLQKSMEDIALLFRLDKGIDRAAIGDYLGHRDDTALSIMHSYINTFEFDNMCLDAAVRAFVSCFRLCGEAQKIDRILEAFAVRYCECNPTVFSSAGTAHTLAFSIIMLNTDAHNPAVKVKMKKSEFIRNNRGIDEGKDLPADMLGELYERIVKNEIKMAEEEPLSQVWNKSKRKFSKLSSMKSKSVRKLGKDDLLLSELEASDTMNKIQLHLDSFSRQESAVYLNVSDMNIAKEMMKVMSSTVLTSLTIPLDYRGTELGDQCIEGLRLGVEISSLMELPGQRDDFHSGLTKFMLNHSSANKSVDKFRSTKALSFVNSNQPIDFAAVQSLDTPFFLSSILSCCFSKRIK